MKRLTIGVKACTEIMGLLVSVAWADGSLDDEEKAGIRAASDTLNLNKELRDRLESFMEKAPPLGDLDLDALSGRDREFAYVASVWLANVAKGVDESERDLLDKIGMVLDIDGDRRAELDKLAVEIDAPLDEDSWASGIPTLFKAIANSVEAEEVDVSFA